jgi:hypothetical protein
MKRLFIFIFVIFNYSLFIINYSKAQTKIGKIEIIQDKRVEQLVEKHKLLNGKINGIPGFRIQIFSESGTNSKNKANNVKTEFQKSFSDISAYLIFQEPNYKVRIGDFRTQLDALGFLKKIQINFPNAFIVSDKINFTKIN